MVRIWWCSLRGTNGVFALKWWGISLGAGTLRQLAGFGVAVWTIGHVGALTASADTLPGALIQAYVNNPQLNSQRAVVRATDEGVPQALSGYKPRVTATASTGQQYATGVSKVPFTAAQVGTGS